MSIQSARALYTKLLVDEEFRKRLEQAANYEQRYAILQAAGFSCTPTELKLAKNELLQSIETDEVLSEIEQDFIQGGNSIQFLLTHFVDILPSAEPS